MKQSEPSAKSTDILRSLMDPDSVDAVPWSADELKSILEHQLASPLADELERFVQVSSLAADRIQALVAAGPGSFREALLGGTPPVEMVRLVKDFAKASLAADDDLPRDAARVLYILAIVQGQRLGDRGISTLDHASLRREVRRCLTFAWLPAIVRQALRDHV